MSQKYKSNNSYKVYRIGNYKDNYAISDTKKSSIYDGSLPSSSSYRKAHLLPQHIQKVNKSFTHKEQTIKNTKVQRIYSLYQKEFQIFTPELMQDLPLKPNHKCTLPSFLAEFSMIDKTYLQTLFFTKKINKQGLYQYFVRRNGEYYVQFIDDEIPFHQQTNQPLWEYWGLRIEQPWKIILMKAWLKEKKQIKNVETAQPFEFIEAFGFPGYRLLNLKKDISNIKNSQLKQSSKQIKMQRIPFDKPGFIVVGKTRSYFKFQNVGLVPNRAAYRINLQDHVYKVQSFLPSNWQGQLSFLTNSKIYKQQYNQLRQSINITHADSEFLATQREIYQLFTKFYIVPQYPKPQSQDIILDDSYRISYKPNEYFVFELKITKQGPININIDLDFAERKYKLVPNNFNQAGNQKNEFIKLPRYNYIKYFMAKKQETGKDAALGSYSYYDGQYVKGYHKNCSRFITVQKGTYYIYFKIEPYGKFKQVHQPSNKQLQQQHLAISISASAKVSSFARVDPSTINLPFIMQCALHNYNLRKGLKTYTEKKDGKHSQQLIVHSLNMLNEIGFGIISITANQSTQMMLFMILHLEYLQMMGLDICHESIGKEQQKELKKVDEKITQIKFMVKKGQAKTIIVENLTRQRSKQDRFPPANCVDFVKII